MIIAVDIDDVLADTLNGFLKYYNKKYNTKFQRRDFNIYHWGDVLGLHFGDFLKIFKDYALNGNFRKLLPARGAQAAMAKLKKNHSLVVVTGRENYLIADTEYWLKRYYPGIFSGVHYTASMLEKEKGKGSKTGACWQEGVDLMIEDQYDFAKDCAADGIKTLLMECPWNRDLKLPANIIRVKSWREVLSQVNTLKNHFSV